MPKISARKLQQLSVERKAIETCESVSKSLISTRPTEAKVYEWYSKIIKDVRRTDSSNLAGTRAIDGKILDLLIFILEVLPGDNEHNIKLKELAELSIPEFASLQLSQLDGIFSSRKRSESSKNEGSPGNARKKHEKLREYLMPKLHKILEDDPDLLPQEIRNQISITNADLINKFSDLKPSTFRDWIKDAKEMIKSK